MTKGEEFVRGQTYSYWTDRLRELTHPEGPVPPSVAVVVYGDIIAGHIDLLERHIADLKAEIAELRRGPYATSSAATVTSATSLEARPTSEAKVYHVAFRFKGCGPSFNVIYLIKEIRRYTGLGLRDAKDLAGDIMSTLAIVARTLPIENPEEFQKALDAFDVDFTWATMRDDEDNDVPVKPLYEVKAPT